MSSDSSNDDSLYPIAVLIDELRNEDVQVILFLFKFTFPFKEVKSLMNIYDHLLFNDQWMFNYNLTVLFQQMS